MKNYKNVKKQVHYYFFFVVNRLRHNPVKRVVQNLSKTTEMLKIDTNVIGSSRFSPFVSDYTNNVWICLKIRIYLLFLVVITNGNHIESATVLQDRLVRNTVPAMTTPQSTKWTNSLVFSCLISELLGSCFVILLLETANFLDRICRPFVEV